MSVTSQIESSRARKPKIIFNRTVSSSSTNSNNNNNTNSNNTNTQKSEPVNASFFSPFPIQKSSQKYTHIVVGSGPAGCLAARMLASSSPTSTVLLVEAGPNLDAEVNSKSGSRKSKSSSAALEGTIPEPDQPDAFNILWDPAKVFQVMSDSQYYTKNAVASSSSSSSSSSSISSTSTKTAPTTSTVTSSSTTIRQDSILQGTSKSIPNRTFAYRGPKLFGGGSSINGLQFVPGTITFFNKLVSLPSASESTNNNKNEWLYSNAQDKWIKLLNLDRSAIVTRTCPDPRNGWVTSFERDLATSIQNTFKVPLIEEGKSYVQKNSRGEVVDTGTNNTCCSFMNWELYQHPDGKKRTAQSDDAKSVLVRTSASRVLFGSSVDPQITVMTNSFVRRLAITDAKTLQSIIVESTSLPNAAIQIEAEQSIFICAGVGSAPLLLRSGIGPEEQLKKAGIPVIRNVSAVGENLMDHTYVMIQCEQRVDVNSVLNRDIVDVLGGWYLNKKGSLEEQEMGKRNPNDVYYGGAFLPFLYQQSRQQQQQQERAFEITGMYVGRNIEKQSSGTFNVYKFNILISALQPTSRGTIRVVDNQGSTKVDLNILDEKSGDVEQYMTILPPFLNMIQDPKQMNMRVVSPGLNEAISNPQELRKWIIANIDISDHWMGTCSLGTVVDFDGKLMGFSKSKIYVADASICPLPYDANTSSFAYVASAIITSRYLKQQ